MMREPTREELELLAHKIITETFNELRHSFPDVGMAIGRTRIPAWVAMVSRRRDAVVALMEERVRAMRKTKPPPF